MVTASAPGKVYLFGEHAVVYGEPAVPCAIERRATVTVDRRDEGVRVDARDLSLDGFAVEFDGTAGDGPTSHHPDVDAEDALVEAGIGYVTESIQQAADAADREDVGFEVTIESEIPLGGGLGSSAAVSVATIAAATTELGVDLSAAEIANRAYAVEHAVQDGEASRADTFCSAMGGAVRVEGEDCRRIDDVPDLPLVVGYDGGSGDTGELVAGVRRLREDYDFAADTVTAIGDLVRAGETALEDADMAELGRLMDVNHGLLAALGVSARSLDEMVWTARSAGATGAKLTGAGGGGSIVAVDPTGDALDALEYAPVCAAAFPAGLDETGVRIE